MQKSNFSQISNFSHTVYHNGSSICFCTKHSFKNVEQLQTLCTVLRLELHVQQLLQQVIKQNLQKLVYCLHLFTGDKFIKIFPKTRKTTSSAATINYTAVSVRILINSRSHHQVINLRRICFQGRVRIHFSTKSS